MTIPRNLAEFQANEAATMAARHETFARHYRDEEKRWREIAQAATDNQPKNLPCGCSVENRSLCPHGNSDLA